MHAHKVVVGCLLVLSIVITGCDSKSSNPPAGAAQAQSPSTPPAAKAESAKPASPANPSAGPATTPPAAVQGTGPHWQLTTDTIDFGTVWAGEEILKNFTYKNVGDKVLNIIQIKPHCSCSAAENYTKQVPPGGEGVVPFKLNTRSKHGPVREYLDVTTDDPKQRIMRVWLTGTVMEVCRLEVIEDSIYEAQRAAGNAPAEFPTRRKGHFGRIERDDNLRRVIKLINTSGVEPLTLELLPTPPGGRFDLDFKETVPGAEFTLTIVRNSPFMEGYSSVAARLKTNVPERPIFTVPITAQVPPRIEIRPPKIVIDRKFPGRNQRLVRIVNNGSAPLNITGIETTEPRYNLEMIDNNYAETKTYLFKIDLPSEDYRPPPYGEIIRIHTDDTEHKVVNIFVLPSLRAGPTPRPADKPATFHPGKTLP